MGEAAGDMQTSDATLVTRIRQRDPSAREELFYRYRGVAYRVAYRLLGHEEDALDAVQDAMLKAFSALDRFDGRSEFRTWLLRIVTNAALDGGRKRKRYSRSGPSIDHSVVEPASHEDPANDLQQQDLRRILDRALDALTPTLRGTFVLFAETGLSYKEIAEIQQVPIGTVMSRIHAARDKLQASLDWEQIQGL
jgi:RNA polymerase sigma-70 factor (ECF subfamily)